MPTIGLIRRRTETGNWTRKSRCALWSWHMIGKADPHEQPDSYKGANFTSGTASQRTNPAVLPDVQFRPGGSLQPQGQMPDIISGQLGVW